MDNPNYVQLLEQAEARIKELEAERDAALVLADIYNQQRKRSRWLLNHHTARNRTACVQGGRAPLPGF